MKLPRIRDYPKTVHIKDAEYQIKFVRKVRGEGGTLGECDTSEHRIRIKLGQSSTETFNTFVHEILHAIETEYSIQLKHSDVYKLERALSDFLMTNF